MVMASDVDSPDQCHSRQQEELNCAKELKLMKHELEQEAGVAEDGSKVLQVKEEEEEEQAAAAAAAPPPPPNQDEEDDDEEREEAAPAGSGGKEATAGLHKIEISAAGPLSSDEDDDEGHDHFYRLVRRRRSCINTIRESNRHTQKLDDDDDDIDEEDQEDKQDDEEAALKTASRRKDRRDVEEAAMDPELTGGGQKNIADDADENADSAEEKKLLEQGRETWQKRTIAAKRGGEMAPSAACLPALANHSKDSSSHSASTDSCVHMMMMMQMISKPGRVCRACGRVFPSGRALGGHMRVHGPLFGLNRGHGHGHASASCTTAQHQESLASTLQLYDISSSATPPLHNPSPPPPSASAQKLQLIPNSSNCLQALGSSIDPASTVVQAPLNEESSVSAMNHQHSSRLAWKAAKETLKGHYQGAEEEEEEEAAHDEEEDDDDDDDGSGGAGEEEADVEPAASASSDPDDDDSLSHRRIRHRKERSLDSLQQLMNPASHELTEAGRAGFPAGGGDDHALMAAATKRGSLLYQLRREPKRSLRFTDREFTNNIGTQSVQLADAANYFAAAAARSTSPSPERTTACTECGKVFWSQKALFGHMRCHPERQWRGIQPPAQINSRPEAEKRKKRLFFHTNINHTLVPRIATSLLDKASDDQVAIAHDKEERADFGAVRAGRSKSKLLNAADEVADQVDKETENYKLETTSNGNQSGDVNMVESCPAWPTRKRSKRMRPSSVQSPMQCLQRSSSVELEAKPILTSGTSISDECKDDVDMATCLVMLSSATAIKRPKGASERIEIFCTTDQELDGRIERDGIASHNKGDPRSMPNNVHQVSNTSTGELKYWCSTCNKCFTSHQALGGHRASHKKMKGCFARTHLTEEVHESTAPAHEAASFHDGKLQVDQLVPPSQAVHRDISTSHSANKEEDEKKIKLKKSKILKDYGHECSICHRIFPTGQALGGHKRCHWTGDKYVEAASVASSCNKKPDFPISGGQTRTLQEEGIDLNLPAPMDNSEEEYEDEAGYGGSCMQLPVYYTKFVDASKNQGVGHSVMEFAGRSSLQDGTLSTITNCTVKDILGSNESEAATAVAMAASDCAANAAATYRFDGTGWASNWPMDGAAAAPSCALKLM